MKLDEMRKRLQTLLRCILDEEDEEGGGKSGLLCLRIYLPQDYYRLPSISSLSIALPNV